MTSAGNQDADMAQGVAPGTWRFAMAQRAHVVIDAAAYFTVMQDAMLQARQRIHLIGWDFDTRVRLGPGRRWWNRPDRTVQPARLGAFVVWLVNRRRGLQVRVLKWNFGAFKFIFRGSMVLDLIRWWAHPAIDFKFDSAHPLGCSHHQKIVVIDDRFAVCGGIDMTTQRWDTPEHIEEDPRRMGPRRKPYGPWHDITLLVEGDAAASLGELGRMRWSRAGGGEMEPCLPQHESPWPKKLRAEFRDVELGIARTQAAWAGTPEITEIEHLFAEHIRRARRFIYAESQYFASRKVAEALAERLSQPDPPEVVLINPKSADGWLEQTAMDGARVRLLHAIAERDPQNRFRIFIPVTTAGTPIYVHSKLMIVDDEILRIGSANMNNRSMGLDTEADVFIDCARPANDRDEVRSAIRRIRHRLIAEHCGMEPEHIGRLVEKHGSMTAMIEARIDDAEAKKGKRLERFHLRPLSETEKAIADTALLDPERPGELFEPIGHRRGLFRLGSLLRRPK
ncbi:phospholipase D-like domain-containing protein [Novosphingobium sp. TH158]|uniref:phospholipase D-like domain-containing protein n=1 Tax=Novosphingobium sp. TH158 TaxID=2067455 RepID=UPI000C7C828D|nr:phospholipase D-like domain-containing protein [Novosphingobium sp. TH158]PLK26282.1 phospholipase [Novosphingobium sp. TH158]